MRATACAPPEGHNQPLLSPTKDTLTAPKDWVLRSCPVHKRKRRPKATLSWTGLRRDFSRAYARPIDSGVEDDDLLAERQS